jgi:UDP-N-acetylglucosamine--N-acetylmuramyl-(pentapeptide) pyrophosphoryl-undecaprenol N-acetylglucosamine transferase
MKIMVMAGGTGGHVFPALAVAQVLRAQGHEIVWMGAPESFESRVVPQQSIPIEFIRVQGLRGKGLARWFKAPLVLIRSVMDALGILHRQQPAVVLGMGGFAAGPGGLAAWMSRRPLVIHEQNAAAGLTNRWLAHLAKAVLEAFPGTFKGARTVGNPVRRGFAELPDPSQRIGQASDRRRRLLVIGGSQGAKSLNTIVPAALALLSESQRPQVRHQAGRTLDVAKTAYLSARVDAELLAFIEDMPAAYAWADLVVCRAGASTVAELAAAGCAALLVPFPAAVDDHQTRNAEYLVKAGGAVLVQERDLDAPRLASLLRDLLDDTGRLISMARAARTAAWPQAVEVIAQCCLEVAAC